MNLTYVLSNVPALLLLGLSVWSLRRNRTRPTLPPPPSVSPALHPERWLPLAASSSLATCAALVSELPQGWQLSFFAADHPSLTDPGGYVKVQRTATDKLLRMVANYGWSSDWVPVTEKDVQAELYRNRAAQPQGVRIAEAPWVQLEAER